jgi:HSP20 family protein
MNIVPRKNRQNSNAISLRDAMNQMFNESFWDPWTLWDTGFPALHEDFEKQMFVPRMDISEDDKQIKLSADVPGYDTKDIEVTFDDNILTIQGKMQTEKKEDDKNKKWYRRECSCGSFYQQFKLPAYADESGILCKAKNGKLTVTIPIKEVAGKTGTKQIPIDVD